jgi:hypothetical protein
MMSEVNEQVVAALSRSARVASPWSSKSSNTNDELKSIMSSMNLKIDDVMRLSMTSYDTVKSWRVNRNSKRWRRMPDRVLSHIKIQLGVTGDKRDH